MEPIATNFLAAISADLVHVAACSIDLDMHKAWLFATSFLFRLLPLHVHTPRGPTWLCRVCVMSPATFAAGLLRSTPPLLADMYAEQALPLFDVEQGGGTALSFASVPLLSKPKALHEAPVASQDGAGILSTPDWSAPPSGTTDVFARLRPKLMAFLLQGRFPQRLRTLGGSAEPLFSSSEIDDLRGIFQDWLSAHFPAISVSWEISAGQPYCLQALAAVSRICQDRDSSLFPCLEQGVPTGFDGDIPLSNVFLPQGGGHPFEQSLGICHGNWSSAEADLPTLHALVEEEISNGWFLELDSLEAAQERFGDMLAIGKMSIVKAEGKKPRLVVDSTVCGTNPSCSIPETYSLPRGLLLTSSPLTKRFEFAIRIRGCSGSPSREFEVLAVVSFFTAFVLSERTSRPSGSSDWEAFSFALFTFGPGSDTPYWATWTISSCSRTRRSSALQRA